MSVMNGPSRRWSVAATSALLGVALTGAPAVAGAQPRRGGAAGQFTSWNTSWRSALADLGVLAPSVAALAGNLTTVLNALSLHRAVPRGSLVAAKRVIVAAGADGVKFRSSETGSLASTEALLSAVANDQLVALGRSVRSREALIAKWDSALLQMGATTALRWTGLRQGLAVRDSVPLSSASSDLAFAYDDATGVLGGLLSSGRAAAKNTIGGVRNGLETAARDLTKLGTESEQALAALRADVGSTASGISSAFVSASPTISQYAHTLAAICGVGTLATFWVPAVGEAFAACDVGASAAAMLADAVDPQTSTAHKAVTVGLDAVGFLGGAVGIGSAAGLAADLAEAQAAAGSDYATTLVTDAMLGDYTSVSESGAASLAQDAVITNAREMELLPKVLELSGHSLAEYELNSGMVSPQALDATLAALEAKSQTAPKTLGLVQSLTGAAASVDAALNHSAETHSGATDPNQRWTASGVQLSAGELVQVVATGRVWYNVNQPRSDWTWSTPAGWSWGSKEPFPNNYKCPDYTSVFNGDILARGLPCGSLLGKIGTNGTVFELGALKAFTAPVSGELYLGENTWYWGSERGGYTVTVSGDLASAKQPTAGQARSGEPTVVAKDVQFARVEQGQTFCRPEDGKFPTGCHVPTIKVAGVAYTQDGHRGDLVAVKLTFPTAACVPEQPIWFFDNATLIAMSDGGGLKLPISAGMNYWVQSVSAAGVDRLAIGTLVWSRRSFCPQSPDAHEHIVTYFLSFNGKVLVVVAAPTRIGASK